jgi:predicted Zn-dependent peptidase
VTRALVFAAMLAACGASPSPHRTPTMHVDATESDVSGVTLITRERGGSGHVVAGLFVRVRADPPALATAAALVLEERSAGRLVARATADGATLRTTAETTELDRVLTSLAEALSARDASPAEVARALARIRARRAGRASDDRARAARLAVGAMFGSELDALGSAGDDDRLTSERVSELLQSSFGAERALVTVVGDASAQAVEEGVARAFRDAPHVAVAETSGANLVRDARAEVSDGDVVAVARPVPDLAAAVRAGAWIAWADPSVDVSTFSLRGVPMLVAVRDGNADDARALIVRVRRATVFAETASPRVAPDVEHELLALGDAWLARGDAPRGDGLGVGLVLAGTASGADDDDARAAATRAQVLPSLDEPPPERSGPASDATADERLASGARILVRRVSGGTLAVAVAFEGGAILDPPGEHGRAALLANVLGHSCEPDADVTWVDARSIGLVLSGESGTLERTLARAIDCVRRAAGEAARADGPRAEAIAALDDSTRAHAWAASAIAPATPGLVAPSGSTAGIAAASGLDAALDHILVASRATIVVIGDVDPARAVEIADALGSEIAPARGAWPAPPIGAAASSDVFVADPVVAVPEVIVTLRFDGGESPAAARATARSLAAALIADGGAVHFWFGDAALGSSFVAVGVRGGDAYLDGLPARLAPRLAALDASAGVADAVTIEARARALASPIELARSLASDAEPSDALMVVSGLVHATPRYVMLRPSAGPMRPPRHR